MSRERPSTSPRARARARRSRPAKLLRRQIRLRERAEELERLLALLPISVWVAHDPECRSITGNRAAHELLAMPHGANLSRTAPEGEQPTPHQVLHEGRALADHELPLQRAAKGAEIRGQEYVMVVQGAEPKHVIGYATPLHDSAGNVRGGLAALLDITERKRNEDALREADRRKDAFLATLAHELRNPLAPIRSAAHVLRQLGPRNATLSRARDVIDRQVSHMARLLDDLLDASRITHGKLELRKSRIELADVVEAALETSRPALEAGRHQLVTSAPTEPIYLDADLVRLAQVLSNLLNNAARYTNPGGRVELLVRLQGDHVELTVKDNGTGIAPEQMPRIFELFSQTSRAQKRTDGGLGIGLWLVRSLVEMHGGTVAAHSDGADLGSEFVVRLPVLPAVPESTPRSEGRVRPRSAGKRVLIADDNADAADAMAMFLETLGAEVQVVYDGADALDAARSRKPDLILLDIGMPTMDGYEVARRVRGEPWGASITVVALTGWGREEDRRRSREAGFDGHLVKPVDFDALERLLLGPPPRASRG